MAGFEIDFMTWVVFETNIKTFYKNKAKNNYSTSHLGQYTDFIRLKLFTKYFSLLVISSIQIPKVIFVVLCSFERRFPVRITIDDVSTLYVIQYEYVYCIARACTWPMILLTL